MDGPKGSAELESWRADRRKHDLSQALARTGWYHSFELPGGQTIEGCVSLEELKRRLAGMPIPPDLAGKRVLDIGAWDGWFSFEMERRGAEVLAIDCVEVKRFRQVHEQLRSRVDYRVVDLYDLSPATAGRFDVVLFLSVLYHLRHPLLALEKVCALTSGVAIISSFITDDTRRDRDELLREIPRLEFYETDELGGQLDNWCGPNLACLTAMCRAAGFARVQILDIRESSAMLACFRRWEEPADLEPPAPVLHDALHNRNGGINFASSADDYVSCWFTPAPQPLASGEVFPEVGGYGAPALFLRKQDGAVWQTNFRLPPGLGPGWHAVRLRCGASAWSNALRVAVDMPLECGPLEVRAVCDARTYERNLIRLGPEPFVSVWLSGLPENADRANVRVTLDGIELRTTYVGTRSSADWQVNAALPADLRPGRYGLRVICGGQVSPEVPVEGIGDRG